MFTAPDENIKPSRYPDKTIFESLVDPARIYCACWKHQPVPRDPRFPSFFSISGVSSFMRTSQNPAPPSFPRLQKKLTFKPAIKRKNAKSLILVAPLSSVPFAARSGDSWSMRITLAGNLISLISQAKHVRTSPPFRNLRFHVYTYRTSRRISGKYRGFHSLNFKAQLP